MTAVTDLRAIILRYFNPIGSDPELQSGVYVRERLTCLVNLSSQHRVDGVIHDHRDRPPTRDGTGIRDYVHVWDLARAHVTAVERFDQVLSEDGETSTVINEGTGEGVTVRELNRLSSVSRQAGQGDQGRTPAGYAVDALPTSTRRAACSTGLHR